MKRVNGLLEVTVTQPGAGRVEPEPGIPGSHAGADHIHLTAQCVYTSQFLNLIPSDPVRLSRF